MAKHITQPAEPAVSDAWGRAAQALSLAVFLLVVIACAWQCDDAFITHRTARNFWAGHGLTWNPVERVQSFTHPLWMGLALIAHGISGEAYWSILSVSVVLSGAAMGVLAMRAACDRVSGGLAVLALSASAAVVDYSTSGLENPLAHLLVVLFALAAMRESSPSRLWTLSLCSSLLALTRLDLALAVGPLLIWTLATHRPRRAALAATLAGPGLVLAWHVFALVYYGTPLPNTAYAKLNVAIPVSELMAAGARYFGDSLIHDPLTLLLAAGGLVAAFIHRGRQTFALRLCAVGWLLYLAYLLRIGGDFMSGRFFSAPAVWGAVTLATTVRAPKRKVLVGTAFVIVLYGALWPGSRWGSGPHFGEGLGYEGAVRAGGIADERAYYYPHTGLLPVLRDLRTNRAKGRPVPPYPGAIKGQEFAGSDRRVAYEGEVGFFGYFVRPDQYVIDGWALNDPFLARIVFHPGEGWRVGHYPRRLPKGYAETIESGSTAIADPDLARFYERLCIVTRGPLFTRARWREIWRLNTGYYRRRLARPDYP